MFLLLFGVGSHSQEESYGQGVLYCLLAAMQVQLPWPAALQATLLVGPVSAENVIKWSC